MKYLAFTSVSAACIITASMALFGLSGAFAVTLLGIVALHISHERRALLIEHNTTLVDLKSQLAVVARDTESKVTVLEHQLDEARTAATNAAIAADEYAARCISLDFECAYCSAPQTVPYNPNEPHFNCVACQQPNAIYTNIRHARVTDRLETLASILD